MNTPAVPPVRPPGVEDAVRNAVASAALDGVTLPAEFIDVLYEVASGVLPVEDAVAAVIAEFGDPR